MDLRYNILDELICRRHSLLVERYHRRVEAIFEGRVAFERLLQVPRKIASQYSVASEPLKAGNLRFGPKADSVSGLIRRRPERRI